MVREGLHLDHMPSKAALKHHLQVNFPDIGDEIIDGLLKSGASIAIPAHVHRKYSETYGGRNTKTKQYVDSVDLYGAVESNFESIKPFLLEDGYSDGELDEALAKLHKTNQDQGWY